MNVEKPRELFYRDYKILDLVEETSGGVLGGTISLCEIFRMEIVRMIIRFSLTDGRLPGRVTEFLNVLFNMEWSSQDYLNLGKEWEVFGTRLGDAQLLSLILAADYERMEKSQEGFGVVCLSDSDPGSCG